mgnify:CR=1 FL=1
MLFRSQWDTNYSAGRGFRSRFTGTTWRFTATDSGTKTIALKVTDNQGNVRPSVTRHYTSFSQASEENAISRVYLGIHWDFDLTAGINSGNRIANALVRRT